MIMLACAQTCVNNLHQHRGSLGEQQLACTDARAQLGRHGFEIWHALTQGHSWGDADVKHGMHQLKRAHLGKTSSDGAAGEGVRSRGRCSRCSLPAALPASRCWSTDAALPKTSSPSALSEMQRAAGAAVS